MTRIDRILFWAIALSCAGFVFILAIAAFWDHSIIVLHAFQAMQYLVIVILGARRNRWGYFAAIAVGSLWNYVALFVNSFVESGWRALTVTIETGTITRPDQIIAVVAFAFHLALIVAAVLGYLRLSNRTASDAARLAISFTGAVGYFAIIVALFQPRYLPLFGRLLHPHGL
jgi:hypothetical protein